ncbi:hypothetical protein QL285_044064 [Trifolium repens]|jgi:hypothetical protein|nr:hypothetical protein QL285_044064 [Trifolium repens]
MDWPNTTNDTGGFKPKTLRGVYSKVTSFQNQAKLCGLKYIQTFNGDFVVSINIFNLLMEKCLSWKIANYP